MTTEQLIRIGEAASYRLGALLPLRKSIFVSLKCYDDIHPEIYGGLLHHQERQTLCDIQAAIEDCWHGTNCANYVI